MATRATGNKYCGMNWITKERRLALYLRDGLACVYCGTSVEDGAQLTLDHIVPYSAMDKPDNSSGNLVTACKRCNSSRGNRALAVFCKSVADYLDHGITGRQILTHVRACLKRPVDVRAAKELIARRGGFSPAIAAFR